MLVCWLIMSLAERMSSKFHICPRSFASRSNIHSSGNLSAADIVSRHTSRPKGFIYEIFPNFQNRAFCEKDLKDNKHNSLHLGRKYVRIFVLGHYLFLVAHSFPRATLSENCSLLGTDNVRGQISWHIFAPNGGYCLYSVSLSLHKSRTAVSRTSLVRRPARFIKSTRVVKWPPCLGGDLV